MLKIFIENQAANKHKNIFVEKTLEYIETIAVAQPYPFPYGFILDTTNDDGDNLDAFVITKQKLQKGDMVECEVIGLMEQYEKSWNPKSHELEEQDHNILAVPIGEDVVLIDQAFKDLLSHFVLHVFDNVRLNKTRVGRFLGKEFALAFFKQNRDKA